MERLVGNPQELDFRACSCNDREATRREIPEEPCPYRNPFQRDRDRIIHAKAFRRLMHKAQVFIMPESEHFRTRMTHSLEVMQISRTIGRALRMNEDLIEAIALGHDIGQPPFGHMGEVALDACFKNAGVLKGFDHHHQGWRVITSLEEYKFGDKGINPTMAVRCGILRHSRKPDPNSITSNNFPRTIEEQIVAIGDDIAWLCHDWDDGVRANLLSKSFLSTKIRNGLGKTQDMHINTLVSSVIERFQNDGMVGFDEQIGRLWEDFRERLEVFLWNNPLVLGHDNRAKEIIHKLFQAYLENPNKLPPETIKKRGVTPNIPKNDLITVVGDYISGMTDAYANRRYEELSTPAFRRPQPRPAPYVSPEPWIKVKRMQGYINKGSKTGDQVIIDLGTKAANLIDCSKMLFSVYTPPLGKGGKPKGTVQFLSEDRQKAKVVNLSRGSEISPGDILVLENIE